LRLVANEVLARATTDAERQKLEAVSRILTTTDGDDLVIGQYGCSPR
jgi:hypothetical protein